MRLMIVRPFLFNDTAATEIFPLSLHDALPISAPAAATARLRRGAPRRRPAAGRPGRSSGAARRCDRRRRRRRRSEEHTSELQSRPYLVCRLLLEKKKTYSAIIINIQYLLLHMF